MAPKRKAESQKSAGQPPSKPLKADVQHDERWKVQKPSLIYIGDDLEPRSKIAAFDFDNTLVEWKEGVPIFSTAPDSWVFWNDKVPKLLKELDGDGYRVVIFSNQAQIKTALTGKAATNLKAKIDSVLKAAGIQACAFVATIKDDEDAYRKPKTGMWDMFCKECCGGADAVDIKQSFFVGDAAGRPQDFSDSDKEFAAAAGLAFKTPEEVFGESPRPNKAMAHALRKLAEEVMATGEDKAVFKRNALIKAAGSIEHCKDKIESGKDAMKLPGVGKGTVTYIDEFLEDGVMGERAKAAKAEQEGGGEAGTDGGIGPGAEGKGAQGGASSKGKGKAGLAFLD